MLAGMAMENAPALCFIVGWDVLMLAWMATVNAPALSRPSLTPCAWGHEQGLKRQLRKLGGREEVGGREEATPACASNMTHPHQQSTDASCQQCSKVAAATCRVVASSATLDFWGLCMQFP